MKKYRVGFHYAENGYTDVEAASQEEAEAKVEKALEENGTAGIEIDMVGREYVVTDSHEIEDIENEEK